MQAPKLQSGQHCTWRARPRSRTELLAAGRPGEYAVGALGSALIAPRAALSVQVPCLGLWRRAAARLGGEPLFPSGRQHCRSGGCSGHPGCVQVGALRCPARCMLCTPLRRCHAGAPPAARCLRSCHKAAGGQYKSLGSRGSFLLRPLRIRRRPSPAGEELQLQQRECWCRF